MPRANLTRLGDLLSGLAEVPVAARDIAVAGLTADSRLVKPGWLFVAMQGTKQDGRAYIADAVRAGAAAILTDQPCASVVPVLMGGRLREVLAHAAARFHRVQPAICVAVTGTNGKTSTVNFVRQIWERAGERAASLGTLGLIADGLAPRATLTTPDPVGLHAVLAELARAGIDHLAIEASSHGLDQHRLDGVDFQAAAFTNLTRDHLDYHGGIEAYLAAKSRLFHELLPSGAGAVLNLDSPEAAALVDGCRAAGLRVIGFGAAAGADLRLCARTPHAGGQDLELELFGVRYTLALPLVGGFQASNALAALGLALATGIDLVPALAALESLQGVRGRLEAVGETAEGGMVYVDYAHTPDALETVLQALRPHTPGRLIVLFGCGGDRDPGKRPLMAAAATRFADHAILTDDNPRSEDPAQIRQQAAQGCTGSWEEIAERRAAIHHAVGLLGAGDVLVLAGKGHEQGQIIGGLILPFDDATEARHALAARQVPA